LFVVLQERQESAPKMGGKIPDFERRHQDSTNQNKKNIFEYMKTRTIKWRITSVRSFIGKTRKCGTIPDFERGHEGSKVRPKSAVRNNILSIYSSGIIPSKRENMVIGFMWSRVGCK